jgi:hypothetical protein
VVWASDIVEDWPDDVREAPFNTVVAAEGVQLAESITALLGRDDALSNP